MKTKRDKYEENIYRMLIRCGIPKDTISEPDKLNNKDKEPDFLIHIDSYNLAIEVKHFNDKGLIKKNESLSNELKNGKPISYFIPEKNNAFEELLSSARKKFEKYPTHSSMVVIDISEFNITEIQIESLICGQTTIFITSDGKNHRYTQSKRHLRINKNNDIGAICFLLKDSVKIFHNLMANKQRVMPYYFWTKNLVEQSFNQYAFFCPPGELGTIYTLEILK